MHIAVVGAGGVGGYFAGLLAKAGHRIDLLARGPHLEAIRRRGGIEIREPAAKGGETSFIAAVAATDDATTMRGASHAILAVKSYSLSELAPVLRAIASGGTAIVPLLNGVDIGDRLVELGVARSALLGGLTYVNTARTAPGVVTRTSSFCRATVGEPDGPVSDRVRQLVAALRESGVETEATDAIALELWRKFALLAPLAAVCGLAHRPLGAVRAVPNGRAVLERALREVVRVAQAMGVPLTEDDARGTLRRLDALPDTTRPSFLADVERGGPAELDVLSGAVVRLARRLGVETPLHETAAVAIGAQTSPATQ